MLCQTISQKFAYNTYREQLPHSQLDVFEPRDTHNKYSETEKVILLCGNIGNLRCNQSYYKMDTSIWD